jgi:hypothetical protein
LPPTPFETPVAISVTEWITPVGATTMNTLQPYNLRTALIAMGVCFVLSYVLYELYIKLNENTASPVPTRGPDAPDVKHISDLDSFPAREERQSLADSVTRRGMSVGQQTRLVHVRSMAAAARESLGELKHRLADWTQENANLDSSDLGRRIVASGEQFELYATMREHPHPSVVQMATWESALTLILKEIDGAMSDHGTIPNVEESCVSEVEQLDTAIRAALTKLEQQQRSQRRILSQVTGVSVEGIPMTLGEAIEARRERIAMEQESKVAAQVAQFRESDASRIASERAESMRLELEATIENERKVRDAKVAVAKAAADADARRLMDEAEETRNREATQAAMAEAKRKSEKTKREFEADMTKIRQYLKPFLAVANTQPNVSGFYGPVAKEGPVSLEALRAAGALREDTNGLITLNKLGFMLPPDRPAGGFGYCLGGSINPENVPFTRAAQQLLIKYGDLLVERGMLQP